MTEPQLLNPSSPAPESSLSNTQLNSRPNHPRPPSAPKKPWKWLLGLLILTTGGIGLYSWLVPRSSPPPNAAIAGPRAIPVKWETLQTVLIEKNSTLVGTLEARDGSDLTSELAGRVSQILVKEGDLVQQGQVVMRLDTETLQAELMQAQAVLAKDTASLAELQAGSRPEDIAEAQATLKQVESQLANAKGGASPEEIAQAQAQLDSAKANQKLAQERIKRYQNLRDQGVIALDLFDEQLKDERQAIADVEGGQRRLSQLKKGRNSDIDRIASEVEEKRQNLRRLENGARPEEIAQAKAQVAESMAKVKAVAVKIQKSKITAPFTGIVGYIPTKEGDYVKEGDKLTSLTQNNALEINLSVSLDQASQLRLGLPVQILDNQGQSISAGKISFISPNVNTNAQTVLARASFNNFGQDLLNRQLVQAKIIWSRGPGLLIPAIAVSRMGEETFVFVVQNQLDKKTGKTQLIAQKREVKLGTIQNNSYQVLTGLKAGEKLITAGLMNLQDGVPILEAGKMTMPPQAK